MRTIDRPREGSQLSGQTDVSAIGLLETASTVLASLHGPRRMVRRARSLGLHVAAAALIAGCGAGTTVKIPPVGHHVGPETMFTGATTGDYTPAVLAQLKALGVDRVHIYMHWADIAPDPASLRRPAFDASDPAAYPAVGWAPYDASIRMLGALHIGVDLDLVAPPPDWAEGKGDPRPHEHPEWKPNAAEFAQFVHAVATRYDGRYTPAGTSAALPRVGFWSIWNEPDSGTQISPQAVDRHQVEVAPRYYRAIVDAMWSELQSTGHRHDTILIGEIAPAGVRSGVGQFNQMQPLRFLRALYCVNADYQPLRGTTAVERGCPATSAGSAGFAAANPGLFHATGFADHPYSQGLAPNEPTPDEPDYAELAAIPTLEKTLDRLQRGYGSSTKFPIWSTEFGYQTAPRIPNREPCRRRRRRTTSTGRSTSPGLTRESSPMTSTC